MKQLHLIDDDPMRVAERMARANRISAETARVDPFWSEQERERRAAHYTRIAEQYEQKITQSSESK